MTVSIAQPEALNIHAQDGSHIFFGADQEWYSDDWRRKAGCGPTCAANVTAYLAFTRPPLRELYAGEDREKGRFASHMEDLYGYVTPGNMGLNRLEMFTEGVVAFARSRELALTAHAFDVFGNLRCDRAPAEELAAFVQAGLAADCPVAFLNLTKGRVKNIQAWHWITITAAEVDENRLIAHASDEGNEIAFDLRLWYLSTRMRGGLCYFTEA